MNHYLMRFTLTTLAILLLLTSCAIACTVPSRERIVLRRSFPLEPVWIVAIKTKSKGRIELGKAFDDTDDWFEGLSISLRNNGDKTVTSLRVTLVFPEPDNAGSGLTHDLHFGPSAASAEYLQRDRNRVLNIGKSVELNLSTEDYQSLKRDVAKAGYREGISRLEIEVREIGFEDGSMISDGRLWVQHPGHPDDPTKKINTRYDKKPLLIVLDHYVLHCIGALTPERYQVTQKLVQRAFGGGVDWKQTVRQVLHLEDSLDEHLRTQWKRNQEKARTHGAVLHPAQYAESVVDKNFAPLLDSRPEKHP